METLHPRTIDLGLERIRAVQQRLGLTRPQGAVITVAGTNGKGSTVAMLEAIYLAAGYRVAAYTSPHLLRFNERLRLDGQEAEDAAWCQAFSRIDGARGDITLTYFEFATLAALLQISERQPDIVILEVGMGGRLDAVNIVDPDVAVITAIDLDHTDWLGADREQIACEKAGIMRPGRPVICSDNRPPQSLIEQARNLAAPLYCLGEAFSAEIQGQVWHWRGPQQQRAALPYPALRGSQQLANAAGVVMVLSCLQIRYPVSQQALRSGLLQVRLPGRFQVLPGRPLQVLDVAHNAQAIAQLAASVQQQTCPGRTLALLGMLQDKLDDNLLHPLCPWVDHWYLVSLAAPRAATAQSLQDALLAAGCNAPSTLYDDLARAYAAASGALQENDRLIIFGSFYTVGGILALQH